MKRWQRNTLITGTVLTAVIHRGPAIDVFSAPTAQEVLIASALQQALGSNANVQCLSEGEMGFRLWPFRAGTKKKGFGFAPYSLLWLDNHFCDGLESFADSLHKSNPTPDQILGFRAVAHEDGHERRWIVNESEAECYAVQVVDKLASALGATAAEAEGVRAQVSSLVSAETDPAYSIPDHKCYDGGPLDIEPEKPGIFPQSRPQDELEAIAGW